MADNEPCVPWDINTMCCPNWLPADTTVPEDDVSGIQARLDAQAFAVTWASTFLWRRSRRRFGICESTLFVCPPRCYCTPCACGPQHIIELSPDAPVTEIAEIRDVCSDTIIPSDRYKIINGRSVGLVDRTCSWWIAGAPFDCQLSIQFSVGYVPDAEALIAGGALACAFLDACLQTNCKQGDFLKLAAGFSKRGKRQLVLTGIPLVDQWLIEVNSAGTSGMLDPSDILPYSLA